MVGGLEAQSEAVQGTSQALSSDLGRFMSLSAGTMGLHTKLTFLFSSEGCQHRVCALNGVGWGCQEMSRLGESPLPDPPTFPEFQVSRATLSQTEG